MGPSWWSALLALAAVLPAGAEGQSAATLSTRDVALDDVARLEAFGLVPRGWSAQRPLSVGRVAWIIRDARAWMARRAAPDGVVDDVDAILTRLERRFVPGSESSASGSVGLEVGGGRSPAHTIPLNSADIGGVDAVVNPLWAYQGGREYGDKHTAAVFGGGALGLGRHVALGLSGRSAALASSGPRAGRGDTTLESGYLRAVLGTMALEIGRDSWSWGWGGTTGLLFSDNAPPLDMVRVSTDRPLHLFLLGDTEFTLVSADLGPRQNFPHTKLFGAKITTHPVPGLELGVGSLNKQGGEGAPAASVTDRIKDLSIVWDLFRKGRDYLFSEKIVSTDFRATFPAARGLSIYGQVIVTDFDAQRLHDIFTADAGYLTGVSLPRLGASQRHSLGVEWQRLGPTLYRHHQFTSGMAVEGFLHGAEIGPDGRRVAATYGYYAPARGWSGRLTAVWEDRSVDPHEVVYDPYKNILRTGDLPNEDRARLEVELRHGLFGGSGGVDLRAGLERVTSFDYRLGDDRTMGALLVRVWRTF